MKLSGIGVEMIVKREGLILGTYHDSEGYCTAGVGHLIRKARCTAADKAQYDGWSRQQYLDLFKEDVASREETVDRLVKVPLTSNQFDALVSFVFNIGEGSIAKKTGFITSTVLRKLNAKDYEGAATAFMMWNKPSSIVGRRRTEMNQFRTPYGNQQPVISVSVSPSVTHVDLIRGASSKFAKAEWLHPVFRIRLDQLYDVVPFTNKSGGRSTQRQAELYRLFKAGKGNPANRPGTSWHEYWEDGSVLAQAADIHPQSGSTFAQLHAAGKRHGIHFPVKSEGWHAQPIEAKSSARVKGQGLGPIPAYYNPGPTLPVEKEDDVIRIIQTTNRAGDKILPGVYAEINFAWVRWIPTAGYWGSVKAYAQEGNPNPTLLPRSEFETLEKVGTGGWPND